jgi:hypothetical protein
MGRKELRARTNGHSRGAIFRRLAFHEPAGNCGGPGTPQRLRRIETGARAQRRSGAAAPAGASTRDHAGSPDGESGPGRDLSFACRPRDKSAGWNEEASAYSMIHGEPSWRRFKEFCIVETRRRLRSDSDSSTNGNGRPARRVFFIRSARTFPTLASDPDLTLSQKEQFEQIQRAANEPMCARTRAKITQRLELLNSGARAD